ncbi:hypothetical protein [Pseudomonas monteilii]|uniref:hypothetical protein n=1 Tax=Pseudomonas monteilii TaxID=76759 RepID=UPI0013E0050A|nr:hypothetical protein [Pseudomonas monteilii]QIG20527.1 hypothetical protein FY041_23590 [Pseudomonas monteilii]QIG25777.1 hypothetical protein FY043_23585 [Pseudomonas monteilii]
MKAKPTYQQLMEQIAEAAVDYQRAETKRNSLRNELNAMYRVYFDAYGRPFSDTNKRVNPYDEEFAGVIAFTDVAYERWKAQRDLTTRLKRKLRTLVERLERAQ